MKKLTIIFSLTFLMTICWANAARGQNDQSKEPVLVPLTEEEKKIIPKDIVANQPDFTAVQAYFSAREISGFSTASKVAKKGNKYRVDTGFVVVITEPNKPALRLNQDKTYEETVGVRKPFVSATMPLNPTDLLEFTDISFIALGTIEIEGKKLLKIQAKSKEFNQEVFLYADLGRKNLITVVQILSPQRSSIQRLQEISFDVPAELFDISGYKQLPKFKWEKVKNAKVFYEGKLVADAVVFRSSDYIFVHVKEFKDLLIDLKRKIADTVVFQGLLVAKNGAYIWQTTEEEAISTGEPENYIEPGCRSCVQIKAEANSVTVPDPYNKSNTLAKITW